MSNGTCWEKGKNNDKKPNPNQKKKGKENPTSVELSLKEETMQ